VPVLMDSDRIGRSLTRIAHEIVERNRGVGDLALSACAPRGVPIARRLAASLREITRRGGDRRLDIRSIATT